MGKPRSRTALIAAGVAAGALAGASSASAVPLSAPLLGKPSPDERSIVAVVHSPPTAPSCRVHYAVGVYRQVPGVPRVRLRTGQVNGCTGQSWRGPGWSTGVIGATFDVSNLRRGTYAFVITATQVLETGYVSRHHVLRKFRLS